MVFVALHVVAAFAGILSLYAGLFMFESETGRWQSRIENVWVSIDDRARESGSRSAALFSKVAAIVSNAFDAILGRKIFSARFVGASLCWSFAVEFLLLSLMLPLASPLGWFVEQPSPSDLLAFRYIAIASFLMGLLCSFLSILPILWRSRWAVALTLVPLMLWSLSFALMAGFHTLKPKHQAFFVGLVLSLLSDVLLLALVRFTGRWVSTTGSIWRTASAILIQLSIIYFLVLVPLSIVGEYPDDFRESVVLMALVTMGGLNISTALASSAFLLILLSLIVHRVLWPLLSRILYPLARFQVIHNRRIMLTVGSACLLYSLPLLKGPAKSLIEWIGKVAASA